MRGAAGTFALLLSAWLVYAVCQQDFVLPGAALVAMAAGVLRDRRGPPREPSSLPGWLWAAFVLAPAGLWRGLVQKAPVDAFSALPVLVDSLQAGAVIGGAGLWLLAGEPGQRVRLRLLAWLAVAFSANVSASPRVLAAIAGFGLANLAVLVGSDGPLLRGGEDGRARRRLLPGLLAVAHALAAVALAGALAGTIQFLDSTLTAAFSGAYGTVAQSPVLEPVLRLGGGGGPSARSPQPVLEVQRAGRGRLYLRAQVYEKYRRGGWLPPRDVPRRPLPKAAPVGAAALQMLRFEALGEVVPAPEGLQGSSLEAATDRRGLLFESGSSRPLRLQLYVEPGGGAGPSELSPELRESLLEVPAELRPELLRTADPLVSGAAGAREMAARIEGYFRDGFEYALDVRFPAGDAALLAFLRERRPAYCSYFASAMALLLRTQGVPARVVGGFLAMEVDRGDSERFVVRLRDAHAWTEAYLEGRWVRFDPTPVDARDAAVEQAGGLNLWIDRFSRGLRRIWVDLGEAGPLSLARRIVYPWLLLGILAWILGRELRRQLRARRLRASRPGPEPQRLDLLEAYSRFEAALQHLQPEPRPQQETDRELVRRLKRAPQVPAGPVAAAESFLQAYHAARFGAAEADRVLEEALRGFETAAASKR